MKKILKGLGAMLFLIIILLVIVYFSALVTNFIRFIFTDEAFFSYQPAGIYWKFFLQCIAAIIIVFILSVIFWSTGIMLLSVFVKRLEEKTGEKIKLDGKKNG